MSKIELILGDISLLNCESIVNAAKDTLLGGGGVDAAIHNIAGSELLEECRTLNGCEVGFAKITKGYNLKAKHVIHTVGPVYFNGEDNEEEQLKSCYKECLKLAVINNIKSIAFPCISTGNYSFPHEIAAKIAINEVKEFLKQNKSIDKVIFCCFLKRDYEIYDYLLKPSIIKIIRNIFKD